MIREKLTSVPLAALPGEERVYNSNVLKNGGGQMTVCIVAETLYGLFHFEARREASRL